MIKKEKDRLKKNKLTKDFKKEFRCGQHKIEGLFHEESEIDLVRVLKYDFDKLETIPSVAENIASIILNSEKCDLLIKHSKDVILAAIPSEEVAETENLIKTLLKQDSTFEERMNLVVKFNNISKKFPDLMLYERVIKDQFLKILEDANK